MTAHDALMADLITLTAGVQVDVARNHLYLDGRRFPAGCVQPPDDDPDDQVWGGVTVGIAGRSWSVYVPTENGLVIQIEPMGWNPLIGVTLYATVCAPWQPTPAEDQFTLPLPAQIDPGRDRTVTVLHDRGLPTGQWNWPNAEPGWTAELIPRVSTMHVRGLHGTPLRWFPLNARPWEVPDAPNPVNS